MNKTKNWLKLLNVTIFIGFSILCLCMGMVAIEKSLRLNMTFGVEPTIICQIEIKASSADDSTYETIFNNSGDYVIVSGIQLLEDSLKFSSTFTDKFKTALGTSFTLRITNLMEDTGIKATANDVEGVSAVPNYVAMKPNDGSGNNVGIMSVSGAASLSQLQLSFEEYNVYTVEAPASGNIAFEGNPEAAGGENYTATVTPKAGYNMSISIMTSNGALVEGEDYTWDSSTGDLVIFADSIVADMVITCSTEAKSYTATFNGNGGSDGTSITVAYGSALGSLPTSSRTGYTFNGWYTATSGGTKITTATTMPINGATYYAQWTANTYKIYATINDVKTQIGTYQFSTSQQTKSLSYTAANSTFKATGGVISTSAGSVSGTTLTIPANTASDITVVPKGYWIGTYSNGNPSENVTVDGVTYNIGAVWSGYKYLQFNGATSYNYKGMTQSGTYVMRWIIIGGDSANSTSTYGTGANKEYDTFSSGQVLLMSEKILGVEVYGTTSDWSHYDCNLRTWMNNNSSGKFLYDSKMNLYSSNMVSQNVVTAWYNNTSVSTTSVSCKVFALATGTGYAKAASTVSAFQNQSFIIEEYLGDYTRGEASSNTKMFVFDGANSYYYWTRSVYYYEWNGEPGGDTNYAMIIDSGNTWCGEVNMQGVNFFQGARPCFVMNL